MADINSRVVNVAGRNTKDEKIEITLELSGRMVVYGKDSKEEFEGKLAELINQYAI